MLLIAQSDLPSLASKVQKPHIYVRKTLTSTLWINVTILSKDFDP